MLRALQSRDSGDGTLHGARLISSAERLEECVTAGTFSADLYFRLSSWRLTIPPLRERLVDIAELFIAFVSLGSKEDAGACSDIPPELHARLMDYPWPGNVRELANIARMYAVTRDPERLGIELERRAALLANAHPDQEEVPLKVQVRFASKQLESRIILRALEHYRWNRRRTAKSLQISYRALLYKMKDLDMGTSQLPQSGGSGDSGCA